MKKYFKVLLLIALFIPLIHVKALTAQMHPAGNDYTNLYWVDVDGTVPRNIPQDQHTTYEGHEVYHYPGSRYYGTVGGIRFTSVCIDPGAKKTASSYNCTPYSNPKIKSLFMKEKQGLYSGAQFQWTLAIRMMAADAGVNGGSSSSSMTMYRHHGIGIFKQGSPNSLTNVSETGSSLFAQARQIMKQADASMAGGTTGTTFTVAYKSSSGRTATFEITANKPLLTAPSFECVSGCQGNPTTTWTAGAKKGTITVTYPTCTAGVTSTCDTKVRIKFNAQGGADGDLYICTPNDTNGGSIRREQYFLAYISGEALTASAGTSSGSKSTADNAANTSEQILNLPVPDGVKKTVCECGDGPTPCNCDIHPQDTKHIKLCCDESADYTESYISQPKINEIFCVRKKNCESIEDIVVPGAYEAPAKTYYDESPSGSFATKDGRNLCNVYCTERVYVQIPGSNSGVNGKYFELKKISGDKGDGPFVYGNFSCRNVINYDSWLKDVIDLNKDTVEQYNKYQKNLASYQAYVDALQAASSNVDETKSRAIHYTGKCKGAVSGQEVDGKHDSSCDVTYTAEKNITAEKQYKYNTVKIEFNTASNGGNVDGFNKLEIKPDSTAYGEKNITGMYGTKYKHDSNTFKCNSEPAQPSSVSLDCGELEYTSYTVMSGGCTEDNCSGDGKSCSSDGTTCINTKEKESSSGTATGYNADDFTKPDIKPTYEANKSSFKSSYEAAQTAFNNDVNKLNSYEEQLKKCDNYFNDSTTNETKFGNKINTTASFSWFFTYISVDSTIKKSDEPLITFTPNKTTASMGEYTGGAPGGFTSQEITDSGVEAPHYNTHNGHSDQTGYKHQFVNSITCNNNSPTCGGNSTGKITGLLGDKNNNQKYTSDTLYKYEIKYSNDASNNKFTVYPYGGYLPSASTDQRAFTKHEGQLYVQYSTLHAKYQTTWQFSGLGSDGKFDNLFNDSSQADCAGDSSNANAELYCTLQVTTSLTLVRGCDPPSGVVSEKSGSASNWNPACCKGNCNTRNDDILGYSFKIVDSTKLFPGTTGYTKDSWPEGYSKATGNGHYAFNWFRTIKGRTNLQKIESSSGNDKEFNNSRVTYQFHLNAKAISAIKEYNSYLNNYNALFKGQYTEGANETGPATKYYSEFIENYYNGKVKIYNKDSGSLLRTYTLGVKSYGNSTSLDAANGPRSKVHWDGI